MKGREIGVPTAGVGLRRSAGEASGALVRPLGAFERPTPRRSPHPQLNAGRRRWFRPAGSIDGC
jgi:hypothetical protein